jgi:hypothetical protein
MTYEPPFLANDMGPPLCGEGKRLLAQWAKNDVDLQRILPGLPLGVTRTEAELFWTHVASCTDCRRSANRPLVRQTWEYLKTFL